MVLPRRQSGRDLAVLLLVVIATATCGTQSRPEVPPPPRLVEIVASQAESTLRLELWHPKPGLRAALEDLVAESEEIGSLDALRAKWSSHAPATDDIDLDADILDQARQDGDWAAMAREAGHEPDAVPDAVYLEGFFGGAAKALGATR